MKSLLHQCGFCKDAKRKLGRAFICTSLCLLNFFYVNAQSEKVSVSVKNGTIKELFKTIEKQTTYRFSYRSSEVETGKRITVEATKESVGSLLDKVLYDMGMSYVVENNTIVIIPD